MSSAFDMRRTGRPEERAIEVEGVVGRAAAVVGDGPLPQLRVVHRLTSALRQASTPVEFYAEAVEAVVDLLEVDRASLLLFDPDGVMRFKAWRGLSLEYRQAVEGHTPWTPTDVDAVPILVPDVDEDVAMADYRPVLRGEGIRALAFVPLVHRQRVAGKFMLYYSRPHQFTAKEVAVADILAAHVALALERRRAEDELLRHQEHLELALAAGEMGTWEWDVASATVAWSPTLEALHGLAPGGFEGTFEAFQADTHPDDRARVAAEIRSVLESSSTDTYAVTYRIIRSDGSLRWVSASGQVLRDADGRPQRMLGVCGDVTERERLLQAERSSAARSASLQRVTAELSRAVTVADVASVVFDVALAELGARSGSLCLLDGDELEIVAALGYPDGVMTHWGRFPLDGPLPASDAVRTGQAVFLRSPAERDVRYPVFSSSPVVNDDAFAMLPLIDGDPMGCLVLGFAEQRDFSTDDRQFYATLAGQCAAALARAGLYEQRARALEAAEASREAAERSRDRLAVVARALQASLLPPELPRIPGVDLAARYVAGSAGIDVGGDFYDVFPLDEHRFVAVMGDVCGRGVTAATLAALSRHAIRSAAITTRRPAAILAHLNEILLRHPPDQSPEPCFCTAVVAILDPAPDGSLAVTLAVGGHPLPLLRHPDGTIQPAGATGSLLGVLPDVNVAESSFRLNPGDTLVTFTDGVTERRDAHRQFGDEVFADVLAKCTGDADSIAGAIETAVVDFADGDLTDDMAVLIIRAEPVGPE